MAHLYRPRPGLRRRDRDSLARRLPPAPPPLRPPLILLSLLLLLPSTALAGLEPTRNSIAGLLSSARSFKFKPHPSLCQGAVAADETIEYTPPPGGVRADLFLPASSFSLRGAACDAWGDAAFQLGRDVPPNSSILDTAVAAVGAPDDFAGFYFFGDLVPCAARSAGEGPMCKRKPEDGLGSGARDATLLKFMIGTTDESSDADELIIAVSLDRNMLYLLALITFTEDSDRQQLCSFEAALRREDVNNGDSGGDNTNPSSIVDEAKNEKHFELSQGALTGIVLAGVALAVITAATILFFARRGIARRHERSKTRPRFDQDTAEPRERAPDVYDTIEEL